MTKLPGLDIKKKINYSPHIVILGAGASLATCPTGDIYGNEIPLMNNIIDIIGLRNTLENAGFNKKYLNFEDCYDDIASSGKYPNLLNEMETKIYSYFGSLKLPNRPTIYDYLILSLRKKDIIASFNWDPFLAQAYKRNMSFTDPPEIVFLHGNVDVGICREHKRKGFMNQICSICKKSLSPTKLLYPIKHKNYSSDLFIKNEWDILRWHLEKAYYLTIFGYAAPVTDIEAKTLMLEIWKKNQSLELNQIEIIDIKKREELVNNWQDFFIKEHYSIHNTVIDSQLFRHPRRSCEAFAMATLQLDLWRENKFPNFEKLNELHVWLNPLLNEEKEETFSGNPCDTKISA